jgi:hypothetical protein
VQFKIRHSESLDPITEYMTNNSTPGWIQKPNLGFAFQCSFDNDVAEAKKLTPKQRMERLERFPQLPTKVEVKIGSYVRNP